jgi:hypothetical protein
MKKIAVRTEKCLKGNCCCRTMMDLCAEDLGKEKLAFTIELSDFCNDIGSGEICGALASAVAAIHAVDPESAPSAKQDELMDWFHEKFGGYDCKDIIGENEEKRSKNCPRMILETYSEIKNYLTLG